MAWVFAILSLFSLSGHACTVREVFRELDTFQRSIWSREEPIYVWSKFGRLTPLTYSHDTEIYLSSALKTLRKNAETLPPFTWPSYTIAELAALTKMSEAQVKLFVVQGKALPVGDRYSLADLNPTYFEAIADREGLTPIAVSLMKEPLERVLNQKGIRAEVHQDAEHVEITHLSSEQIPKNLAIHLRSLETEVEVINPHLHIGIPVNAITREQLHSVARATETKIVLDTLRRTPTLDFGAFGENTFRQVMSGRGVVSAKEGAFTTPEMAHDLEIREAMDPAHGMEATDFATKLIQEAPRLLHFGPAPWHPELSYHVDRVFCALSYAGNLLIRSTNPERQMAGSTMNRLAAELLRSTDRDAKTREIHEYLNTLNLGPLLTSELFLRNLEE